MQGISSIQRTTKELRKANLKYGIVERFESNRAVPGGLKSDLFKIFDIIYMDPCKGIVGVQSCGGADFALHYRKITVENAENAIDWLNGHGKIELWGWRLVKMQRGGKRYIWQPRIIAIGYDDFDGKRIAERKTA